MTLNSGKPRHPGSVLLEDFMMPGGKHNAGTRLSVAQVATKMGLDETWLRRFIDNKESLNAMVAVQLNNSFKLLSGRGKTITTPSTPAFWLKLQKDWDKAKKDRLGGEAMEKVHKMLVGLKVPAPARTPHPGQVLFTDFMDGESEQPVATSLLAKCAGISERTLVALINGTVKMTPVLAKKLAPVLGTTDAFWLDLQHAHDNNLSAPTPSFTRPYRMGLTPVSKAYMLVNKALTDVRAEIKLARQQLSELVSLEVELTGFRAETPED